MIAWWSGDIAQYLVSGT